MTFEEMISSALKALDIQLFIGAACGFIISRFTRSRSERDNHEQRLFDNSDRLKRAKDEKYSAFVKALTEAVEARGSGSFTLSNFHHVASGGDLYFSELRNIADACLTGQVSKVSRQDTFIPALREASEKSIPAFYRRLTELSEDLGVEYDAHYDPNNYTSIMKAVEKFGRS
ncbi:hypothetical protein [uncultured Mameliella sp.]|uniref:hypothetical protein n=1 Tax=uncultured Mameliella sp. TaxID=1447087 RepID=UPI00261E01ED|nr:hypothetical protein [uncultured Mameliella sp.]